MSYSRKKTDGNHAAISQALRRVTVVTDVHALGAVGCDLIARHVVTKAPVLIEVKDPTRPRSSHGRSENERRMREWYPDHYRIVMTEAEALEAVGLAAKRERIPEREETNPFLGPIEFKPADLSSLARRAKRRGA